MIYNPKCKIPIPILLVHPARTTLSQRTLVIAQCLRGGEEPATGIAREFADLIVLGHFVAQTIVLARKAFAAAERAHEGHTRLWLVRLHVNFERVLAGKAAQTSRDETWVASA